MTQTVQVTNGEASDEARREELAELRQQLHEANNRLYTVALRAELAETDNMRLRAALAAINRSARAALVSKE